MITSSEAPKTLGMVEKYAQTHRIAIFMYTMIKPARIKGRNLSRATAVHSAERLRQQIERQPYHPNLSFKQEGSLHKMPKRNYAGLLLTAIKQETECLKLLRLTKE